MKKALTTQTHPTVRNVRQPHIYRRTVHSVSVAHTTPTYQHQGTLIAILWQLQVVAPIK